MTVNLFTPTTAQDRVRQHINEILNPELISHGRDYKFYGGNQQIQNIADGEAMLAGPRDTGKTLAWLYRINQLCWLYPGAQYAIVRKRYEDMPGSVLQSFQEKILKPSDRVTVYGGINRPEKFIYPNGSVIWVGGLDKPGKTLSVQRDGIYVNQAEELIQPEWEILRSSATGRAGHVPFSFLGGDCNPAAPTHWIQSRKKSGTLQYFESFHRDNPEIYDQVTGELTPGGRKRVEALQSMTGVNYQRLYLGLWAQPEGAIYDIFDETRHKVRDFPIPLTWPRAVGIDPFGAYIAAVWLAYDPENSKLVIYREYYKPFGETTPQHVANILELSGYSRDGRPMTGSPEPIFAWVGGGPSERQARLDWSAAGIPLLENSITEVWSQIDKVYQLFKDGQLVVFESCVNLLSEIGNYRRKIIRGVTSDTEIEDKDFFHLCDATRYICAYLATPAPDAGEVVYDPIRIGRF